MKAILRNYGINMNPIEKQIARSTASDMTRTRGTGRIPKPPRDLFVQAAPRGILLNWRPPGGFADDIAGFRIYKDNEMSLFAEIRDPSTTQHMIDTTATSTPPVVNLFVSSFNKLGMESPIVQVQGQAEVESGAPPMPGTPGSYGTNFTGRGAGGQGHQGEHQLQ